MWTELALATLFGNGKGLFYKHVPEILFIMAQLIILVQSPVNHTAK